MASNFQLVARSGPTAGTVYPLESQEMHIGRDLNNDIVINDPEVSRRHARLFLQGSTYVLEDLGSTNGTLVNGQRVVGPYILNSGEEVTLGEKIRLVFESTLPMGGEATIVSGGIGGQATVVSSAAPVAHAPAPSPYLTSAPEPALSPEPYVAPMYSPPQAYAGQVPAQPRIEPVGARKKIPVGIIVAVILLVIVCVCVGGLIAIDQMDMWCNVFGFIFNMFTPGACPP